MRLTTVVVAARHPAVRAACASALAHDPRVRVVAEAETLFDLARAILAFEPRIVVLGAGIGRRPLPSLLAALGIASATTRVIVVGGRTSRARIVDALAHGAHGHIERRAVPGWLAKAVRVVDAGETWCSRRLVPELVARVFDRGRVA